MFHRFRPAGPGPGAQGALTADQLEAVLRFVGTDRILPPGEWLARLEHGALGDEDLCLTFDDGLRSQRDHALPLLERHGLQAFWFVCSAACRGQPIWSEVFSQASVELGGMQVMVSAFLERLPSDVLDRLRSAEFERYATALSTTAPFYSRSDLEYRFIRNRVLDDTRFVTIMNGILLERGIDSEAVASRLFLDDADLARLSSAGHVVGLHSWGHPYEIARLPRAAQRRQYERNRKHLAEVTGLTPIAMSHPLNSYSSGTLAILRELGIRCGFRANTAPPPSRRINSDPLELAREDVANVLAAMEEAY
jgi:peptidoglycan/xylan/chitin deacetylase (PgdA/CDA1 family)